MIVCRKGIIRSGVFYEEGTGLSFPVQVLKGISIPEEKEVYVQFNYGSIAIGYTDA